MLGLVPGSQRAMDKLSGVKAFFDFESKVRRKVLTALEYIFLCIRYTL